MGTLRSARTFNDVSPAKSVKPPLVQGAEVSATSPPRAGHVLVVDDSAAVRDRLSAMLREAWGVARVHEATCVQEALAHLEATALEGVDAIDVVVLDLNLPGAHGFTLLARIVAWTPRPLVIVLTNHAGEQHRKQSVALGADYFFDKSRHFERVVEIVVERFARGDRPSYAAR